MKNIILILLLLPAMAFAQKKSYSVNGNISGAPDGAKVYLKSQGLMTNPIDDSTTIKNEKFTFQGSLEAPVLVQLIIDRTPAGEKAGPSTWAASTFYLENSQIGYSGEFDSLPSYYFKRTAKYKAPVITGSDAQTENVKFTTEINEIRREMQQVDQEYLKVYHMPAMEGKFNTKEGIELANQYNELSKKVRKYTFDYIHEHPESIISYDQASYMLAGYTTTLSVPQIDDLVETIGKAWKGTSHMKVFEAAAESARKTAIGVKYQDFEFITPDGKKAMLSEFIPKGKTVMLEFWASWCGPCRGEIPHLKHLHETKADQFTIISISLDESDEQWRKAMKEEGMVWPQLVDYKGFEGEIAKAYNIFGIPHSIVLDGEGRIMKVGLRGAFLDAYLEKLAAGSE